jgi:uncharacterized membrane protein
MGANASTQVNKQLTDIVTNTTNEIMNSTVNSTDCSNITNQSIKVSVGPGGELNCADSITFNQEARQKTACIAQNEAEIKNALSNVSVNDLETKMKNAMESSGITFGLNVQDATNDIATQIKNNMENSATTTFENSFKNYTIGNQDIEFQVLGKVNSTSCDFNQNMVQESLSSSISKNIVESLASNESLNKIITELENKQENKGVDPLAFLNFLSIGLIILALAIPVGAFFFLKTITPSVGFIYIFLLVLLAVSAIAAIVFSQLKKTEEEKKKEATDKKDTAAADEASKNIDTYSTGLIISSIVLALSTIGLIWKIIVDIRTPTTQNQPPVVVINPASTTPRVTLGAFNFGGGGGGCSSCSGSPSKNSFTSGFRA